MKKSNKFLGLILAVVLLASTVATPFARLGYLFLKDTFFTASNNEYTLEKDYEMSEKDETLFPNSLQLDLAGKTLNLSQKELAAFATDNKAVTIKNGTIENGSVLLAGNVVLENVTFDTSVQSVTLLGNASLLNTNIGTLVMENSVTYNGEEYFALDFIDDADESINVVKVDKTASVGTLILDNTVNAVIEGFVADLVLTENATYSYVEFVENANVANVYCGARNVILNAVDEAYITSIKADFFAVDSVIAGDRYVEFVDHFDFSEMVANLPSYTFLKCEPATCLKTGYVLLGYEEDGVSKHKNFVTHCHHVYDEEKATTLNNIWDMSEAECIYCGRTYRELGQKAFDIENYDDILEVITSFIPDFNFDYRLDHAVKFQDYEIQDAYFHVISSNGKLSGILAADYMYGNELVNLRVYLAQPYLYYYKTSGSNTPDNGTFEKCYIPSTIFETIGQKIGSGYLPMVEEQLFNAAKDVYTILGLIVMNVPQYEYLCEGLLNSLVEGFTSLVPTGFEEELSEISIFAKEIGEDGNTTYTLDLSIMANEIAKLFGIADKVEEKDQLTLKDLFTLAYPADEFEDETGDRIVEFLVSLPNVTMEDLVDYVVALADSTGFTTEQIFSLLNHVVEFLLNYVMMGSEVYFNDVLHCDIRSIVDNNEMFDLTLDMLSGGLLGEILTRENVELALEETLYDVFETYEIENNVDYVLEQLNTIVPGNEYFNLSFVLDEEGKLVSLTGDAWTENKVPHITASYEEGKLSCILNYNNVDEKSKNGNKVNVTYKADCAYVDDQFTVLNSNLEIQAASTLNYYESRSKAVEAEMSSYENEISAISFDLSMSTKRNANGQYPVVGLELNGSVQEFVEEYTIVDPEDPSKDTKFVFVNVDLTTEIVDNVLTFEYKTSDKESEDSVYYTALDFKLDGKFVNGNDDELILDTLDVTACVNEVMDNFDERAKQVNEYYYKYYYETELNTTISVVRNAEGNYCINNVDLDYVSDMFTEKYTVVDIEDPTKDTCVRTPEEHIEANIHEGVGSFVVKTYSNTVNDEFLTLTVTTNFTNLADESFVLDDMKVKFEGTMNENILDSREECEVGDDYTNNYDKYVFDFEMDVKRNAETNTYYVSDIVSDSHVKSYSETYIVLDLEKPEKDILDETEVFYDYSIVVKDGKFTAVYEYRPYDEETLSFFGLSATISLVGEYSKDGDVFTVDKFTPSFIAGNYMIMGGIDVLENKSNKEENAMEIVMNATFELDENKEYSVTGYLVNLYNGTLKTSKASFKNAAGEDATIEDTEKNIVADIKFTNKTLNVEIGKENDRDTTYQHINDEDIRVYNLEVARQYVLDLMENDATVDPSNYPAQTFKNHDVNMKRYEVIFEKSTSGFYFPAQVNYREDVEDWEDYSYLQFNDEGETNAEKIVISDVERRYLNYGKDFETTLSLNLAEVTIGETNYVVLTNLAYDTVKFEANDFDPTFKEGKEPKIHKQHLVITGNVAENFDMMLYQVEGNENSFTWDDELSNEYWTSYDFELTEGLNYNTELNENEHVVLLNLHYANQENDTNFSIEESSDEYGFGYGLSLHIYYEDEINKVVVNIQPTDAYGKYDVLRDYYYGYHYVEEIEGSKDVNTVDFEMDYHEFDVESRITHMAGISYENYEFSDGNHHENIYLDYSDIVGENTNELLRHIEFSSCFDDKEDMPKAYQQAKYMVFYDEFESNARDDEWVKLFHMDWDLTTPVNYSKPQEIAEALPFEYRKDSQTEYFAISGNYDVDFAIDDGIVVLVPSFNINLKHSPEVNASGYEKPFQNYVATSISFDYEPAMNMVEIAENQFESILLNNLEIVYKSNMNPDQVIPMKNSIHQDDFVVNDDKYKIVKFNYNEESKVVDGKVTKVSSVIFDSTINLVDVNTLEADPYYVFEYQYIPREQNIFAITIDGKMITIDYKAIEFYEKFENSIAQLSHYIYESSVVTLFKIVLTSTEAFDSNFFDKVSNNQVAAFDLVVLGTSPNCEFDEDEDCTLYLDNTLYRNNMYRLSITNDGVDVKAKLSIGFAGNSEADPIGSKEYIDIGSNQDYIKVIKENGDVEYVFYVNNIFVTFDMNLESKEIKVSANYGFTKYVAIPEDNGILRHPDWEEVSIEPDHKYELGRLVINKNGIDLYEAVSTAGFSIYLFNYLDRSLSASRQRMYILEREAMEDANLVTFGHYYVHVNTVEDVTKVVLYLESNSDKDFSQNTDNIGYIEIEFNIIHGEDTFGFNSKFTNHNFALVNISDEGENMFAEELDMITYMMAEARSEAFGIPANIIDVILFLVDDYDFGQDRTFNGCEVMVSGLKGFFTEGTDLSIDAVFHAIDEYDYSYKPHFDLKFNIGHNEDGSYTVDCVYNGTRYFNFDVLVEENHFDFQANCIYGLLKNEYIPNVDLKNLYACVDYTDGVLTFNLANMLFGKVTDSTMVVRYETDYEFPYENDFLGFTMNWKCERELVPFSTFAETNMGDFFDTIHKIEFEYPTYY